jgi:hypothetical protein
MDERGGIIPPRLGKVFPSPAVSLSIVTPWGGGDDAREGIGVLGRAYHDEDGSR